MSAFQNTRNDSPETSTVRAGINSDQQHGSVMPPVFVSVNHSFDGLHGKREYDYARSGNPTRDLLANTLAELEGGAGAEITGSGMSAVVLVLHLLEAGDWLFAPHDCYGGCRRAFESLAKRGNFRLQFVDFSDIEALEFLCAELNPRMIWVETPSNPLLRITDITTVSDIAKTTGALLVVDNTFLTPLLQKPIQQGADIVVHSTTKYINGHSDVTGGAVIAKSAAIAEELRWWGNCTGVTASPWDCNQVLRGLRTLHVRMQAHLANTRAVITCLESHSAVETLYYPGLAHHPGHDVAARQQEDFGAIVSFDLRGGESAVARFVRSLKHFTLAESLGGVESLVSHSASMTHASMSAGDQREAGITPGLVRLSVGIENHCDLVADLSAALDFASLAPVESKVADRHA